MNKNASFGATASESHERPLPVVRDTDVLVIGAGIAGLTAAIEASDNGAEVIILDKGPFARSGSSGMNWGYWFLSELSNPPWPDNPDHIFGWLIGHNEGIGDQRILRSLAERLFEEKRALWAEKTGSVCQRVAPDKVDFHPGTSSVYWTAYPWAMGQEVLRRGIPVFERTMVTSLLTHDGSVVGATAMDIRTGGFIVFKAKSVILATGSFGWLYGWTGVSPLSAVQPECTGDGHALLYHAGAELLNMEFGKGEWRQVSPSTLAGSFAAVCAAPSSPEMIDAMCNKDGEYFFKQEGSGLDDFATLTLKYGLICETITNQVKAGKGGPNGGVFYDAEASWEKNPYKAILLRAKEYLGWDACAQPVEVLPSLYDWGVSSLVQANINEKNETTVPGLYAIALGSVAWTGNAWGLRAGKAAAERAKGMPRQPIDSQQSSRERERVYALLEKSPRNPLRPHVIRHRVQRLATQYLGLDRNETGLKECVAEIERIRREDYPRMWVASKTHTWNREFVEALETEFMIDVQEMVARSALMRTESRLSHWRSDYPKRDNENWLANVYVRQADGKMTMEKRPVVATEVPAEKIRGMLQ